MYLMLMNKVDHYSRTGTSTFQNVVHAWSLMNLSALYRTFKHVPSLCDKH